MNPERASTHVDGDTFPSKSTRLTDAAHVILTISGCEAVAQRSSSPPSAETRTKADRS
jgi:hypothetical protein